LKEVSTRRVRSKRRGGRTGSVGGVGAGVSEATTFFIYSDTSASSAETKRNTVRPFSPHVSSHSSDISASDSASNSAWKNVNHNRRSGAADSSSPPPPRLPPSPPSPAGTPGLFGYRLAFVGILFSMVITGTVVVITLVLTRRNVSTKAADISVANRS